MKNIQANNYAIYFNENGYQSLNKLLVDQPYSKIFVIVDTNSHEFCLPHFLSHLETNLEIEIIEFEHGEANKNITTCVEIWNILTDLGADRKSLIINLGGGVVTDLGGFVASTFKRGIDCIAVPTTLLAMVDASIGGKNGVDLGNLKNQIGVINTPKMVLVDTHYLQSLPQNEMRSGMAEMLKHGLIFDKKYWQQFLDLKKLNLTDLDQLIFESIDIKNQIVMQDPNEIGIRKALNFGHTLGHAIESYFLENQDKTTLLHGEAIAIGMILESFISLHFQLIDEATYTEIKTNINSIFDKILIQETDINPILALLIHDKKNEFGKIKFVLLDGIGNTKNNIEVGNDIILAAFEDYKN